MPVPPTVERWLRRRTSAAADWPLARLLERKGTTTVTVVLPALDEAATVGAVVREVARLQAAGLVDQLLVIDAGSSDATAEIAARAGAEVIHQAALLPAFGDRPGKGEALWKSLAAATGDVIAFLDADLEQVGPALVPALLGPLLTWPEVAFVKAASVRPLHTSAGVAPEGGGRVTELVARPLLSAWWPELTGFAQPLAGEYAARRDVLERLPFASGYAVELAMLIDLLELVGLDAMAQVDVGRRIHRHQSDAALGAMALELQLAAWSRLERAGRVVAAEPPATELVRVRPSAEGFAADGRPVAVGERPPMAGCRHSSSTRLR